MAFMDTDIATAKTRARAPRMRTLIQARIFGDRLPEQDVVIRNISTWGVGLVSRGIAPEANEGVVILFPDGSEAFGIVQWVDGKAFGVRLEENLNVRQLGVATQRRNELFGQAIRWEVDQRFREEPRPDTSKLRRV